MQIGTKVKSRGNLDCGILTGTIFDIVGMNEYAPIDNLKVLLPWCNQLNISAQDLMSENCCYVKLDKSSQTVPGKGKFYINMAFPECELEEI